MLPSHLPWSKWGVEVAWNDPDLNISVFWTLTGSLLPSTCKEKDKQHLSLSPLLHSPVPTYLSALLHCFCSLEPLGTLRVLQIHHGLPPTQEIKSSFLEGDSFPSICYLAESDACILSYLRRDIFSSKECFSWCSHLLTSNIQYL